MMGLSLLEEMRALLAQRQNHDETDLGGDRERRGRGPEDAEIRG